MVYWEWQKKLEIRIGDFSRYRSFDFSAQFQLQFDPCLPTSHLFFPFLLTRETRVRELNPIRMALSMNLTLLIVTVHFLKTILDESGGCDPSVGCRPPRKCPLPIEKDSTSNSPSSSFGFLIGFSTWQFTKWSKLFCFLLNRCINRNV